MPEETLRAKMQAVKELVEVFKIERLVHLVMTAFSLLMLFGNAALLIYERKADIAELTMFFGATGLITYSANRLLRMWDQALRVVAGKNSDGDN